MKIKIMDEDFLGEEIREPIIRQQTMEGEITLTSEFPVSKEMKKLNTKRNTKRPLQTPKIKLEKKYIRQDTLEKEGKEGKDEKDQKDEKGMNKNSTTARKYKNQVFIGDDGNYYQSEMNRQGKYIWRLLKK
tara:strand:- start:175 stop:567 length:393 start_codon:yes stop_codon:yes gene_type:complete